MTNRQDIVYTKSKFRLILPFRVLGAVLAVFQSRNDRRNATWSSSGEVAFENPSEPPTSEYLRNQSCYTACHGRIFIELHAECLPSTATLFYDVSYHPKTVASLRNQFGDIFPDIFGIVWASLISYRELQYNIFATHFFVTKISKPSRKIVFK